MLKIDNNEILKKINSLEEHINLYENKEINKKYESEEITKKVVLRTLKNISDSFFVLVCVIDDSTEEWEVLNDLSDSLDILIGRIEKDEDITSIRKVLNEEIELFKQLIS